MAIGITRDFPVRTARRPCRFQINLPRWPYKKPVGLSGGMVRVGIAGNSMILANQNTISCVRWIIVPPPALCFPKSLFQRIGGFDSRYVPLLRSTDLAFKVQAAGFKVLYQPLSEVFHFEGATGGTDISTGTKKHQEINRKAFAAKWKEAHRTCQRRRCCVGTTPARV